MRGQGFRPLFGAYFFIDVKQGKEPRNCGRFRPLFGAYFFICEKIMTNEQTNRLCFRPLFGAYFFILSL